MRAYDISQYKLEEDGTRKSANPTPAVFCLVTLTFNLLNPK